MASMVKLQVVGGGKMGAALTSGLIGCDWAQPGELHVVEPDPARRAELAAAEPGLSMGTEPLAGADAVIAVKPDVVPAAVEALAAVGPGRVLSIAAGVRIAAIEALLPTGTPVVRCMPNTPALVGRGATAMAPGASATEADLAWAESVLAAVGIVITVDEDDLDAVTGLSGSGPAYLFRLAEALRAAGTAQGLDAAAAEALTRQTLLGAAVLLAGADRDPAQLRSDVTSPGGTTAAGLAVLDEADFMGLIGRVVAAAAERSRELGR